MTIDYKNDETGYIQKFDALQYIEINNSIFYIDSDIMINEFMETKSVIDDYCLGFCIM